MQSAFAYGAVCKLADSTACCGWPRHSRPVSTCLCATPLQGSPEELRHAAEVNAADAVPDGKVEPGVSYAEKAKAV